MRRVPDFIRHVDLGSRVYSVHGGFFLRQPGTPIRTLFGQVVADRMTQVMPPRSFSRSQSWASQTITDLTKDPVEDSEPERQERRLKAKTRQVQVQKKKAPTTVAVHQDDDVIELTDSSPSRPTTPALRDNKNHPVVIIDVSGPCPCTMATLRVSPQ